MEVWRQMEQDERFIKKRMQDLADQSYRAGIYTFTGFLTQAEQELYFQMSRELGNIYGEAFHGKLFGGVDGCERQVLRFGDEESFGYDVGFPICCIEISPVMEKFSDKLTHRDYLGALMHLGIERSTLGDIMLREKKAYLFCLDKVADYIQESLVQIKHTNVSCRRLESMPEAVRPQLETVRLVVPSLRVDVVIAKLYHLSRSQSAALCRDKKVFVNGRQTENTSSMLGEQDIVSVRGFGKFICDGVLGETRKGNQSIALSKYV